MARKQPAPPSLHEYELPGGWRCLVGKTDFDNDRLSIGLAHPDDWWFHVKGHPGSHVVLVIDGVEPSKEVRKVAAAVAAWHSKLRDGGMVAVSATRARFVTKPKGAKPGSVSIRKEEVIKVRPSLDQVTKVSPGGDA